MTLMYLYIFLQSNLLEVPFYYLFLRKEKSFLKTLFLITAVNSLTHPIVFFVIMNFKMSYLTNILLAETFAIVMETLFVKKVSSLSWSMSFRAAFWANLVSWQVAPMLTYLILVNFT